MSKRVKVENLEQGKVRLTISVSAEEFDNALDKAFEKVVKEVKVDGEVVKITPIEFKILKLLLIKFFYVCFSSLFFLHKKI